ncbi:MAG: redoxin family protein, partial [Chlorobi bacterium]|nr:redoxin family protein [Chlorobiota bacterium]
SFEIRKIEITDDATKLYFHVSYNPGEWILIPDETYIQVVGNEEKLFITDSEEILVNERFIMPASGETDYTLIFPKIDTSTYRIDYGEANDGGTWFIYNIELKQEEGKSVVPKELLDNWFRKEGGAWELSLLDSAAIYKSKKWNYGKVELNNSKGSIELINKKDRINLFIEKNKNGYLQFGETPNNGRLYCNDISKVSIKNSVIDEPYKEPIFNLDSALFSGYFKGFTERIGVRNLTLHIPDIITGEQTSISIKISEDGYFSVKLPIYYPSQIYIRSEIYNGSVFLEPGKNLFLMLDSGDKLFMGESAVVNSDLQKIREIGNDYYFKAKEKILDMPSNEFKSYLMNLLKGDISKLDSVFNSGEISTKAYQVKKFDIQYNIATYLMAYEFYYEWGYREKHKIPRSQRTIPIVIEPLTTDYFDFITNEFANNQVAVVSSGYSSFINFLPPLQLLRFQPDEYALLNIFYELGETGYAFTQEEKELLSSLKKIETLRNEAETKEYKEKYGKQKKEFLTKYNNTLRELNSKMGFSKATFAEIELFLIENGVLITENERELIDALKIHENSEIMKKVREIENVNKEAIKQFNAKHISFTSDWYSAKNSEVQRERMQSLFGIKLGLATDLLAAQEACRGIVSQMTPVSNEKLKMIQQRILSPFISKYVEYCNDRTKAKIEANKSKTGSVANETPKTEADVLFDSIIKKYRGKVIYVDFWATWCAPCRSGIERIKPLKEEMANEDVVFLYITNPTSPKGTWENFIPDIKGEHYRVSSDEWSYLAEKFNISGIPHYALVGKKGEIISLKLGHLNNNALKTKLRKYINE